MRAIAFVAVATLMAAQPAAADTLTVRMDQSAALHLPAPARDVVIGNPAIADVNMLDARNLVVLGKSFGVTNLLVMDQAGRTILNRQIVVSAPEPSMSFYHGPDVRSYACSDRCERIAGVGDASASAAAPAP
jgi:Flp pilus assembly secretin CpaC